MIICVRASLFSGLVTWIPQGKLAADPWGQRWPRCIQITTSGISEQFVQPINSVLLSEKEEAVTVWCIIFLPELPELFVWCKWM